ncbi:histidine kinase [Streptomyces sp. NPDC051173]|uniref:histidine kinase n=1 Tax=Streptomyces sp. NPDC051173 TaxID=3155164 RepID=UPI00344B6830
MTTRWREAQTGEMIAQSSRYVAWIRVPFFIPLFLAGQHANADFFYRSWFDGLLVAYVAWSFLRLAGAHRRPVTRVRGAVLVLAVDLVLITALAALSGGADSPVRYAFFIWPLATVLWQMPRVTAALCLAGMTAYALMSLRQLLSPRSAGAWAVVVDETYVLWITGVCTLITVLLQRRTQRVSELLDTRELLLDDALAAETRERSDLADALHDGAVQTLLAALHDLEEVEGAHAEPGAEALARAQAGVRGTVKEMREIIFDLHPQILATAGLPAARLGGAPGPPDPLLPVRHAMYFAEASSAQYHLECGVRRPPDRSWEAVLTVGYDMVHGADQMLTSRQEGPLPPEAAAELDGLAERVAAEVLRAAEALRAGDGADGPGLAQMPPAVCPPDASAPLRHVENRPPGTPDTQVLLIVDAEAWLTGVARAAARIRGAPG